MRNYTRLTIEEFGHSLLTTGDLDPIYIMLHRAALPEVTLHRWCMSYWCFYHAGAASKMAEAPNDIQFWKYMWAAADNSELVPAILEDGSRVRWPRGSERRHFRGEQAHRGVGYLSHHYPAPSELIAHLKTFNTFTPLYRAAQGIPQFGPWIAFKIVDMMDRVLGHRVWTGEADLSMYSEPVKGAVLACLKWYPEESPKPKEAVAKAVTRLKSEFACYAAPPAGDRPLSVMEIETVLCKWKSHQNGHYPINNDTTEIGYGLIGWGPLAEKLRACLPHENTYALKD